MRTLTSHISNGQNDVIWQLVLDVEIPLLDVGPLHAIRQGDGAKWAYSTARLRGRTDVSVAGYVAYTTVQHVGGNAGLQRLGIGFVAVGMFEEDTVASPDGPLAIPSGVIGKANARRGIEPFIFHAAGHHALGAALDDPVEGVARRGFEELRIVGVVESIELGGVGRVEIRSREAEFLIEFFLVPSEEAPAQAQVQSEFLGDAPVVLKIGLENFIAVVEIGLCAGLRIAADLAVQ